ncbi:MAG: hypothetical protein WC308_03970 [archaeon]|jgi:hypothetical protein
MYEDIAVNYFRSLSKAERKKIIKGIFDSLTDKEKLEIAQMLVGKK